MSQDEHSASNSRVDVTPDKSGSRDGMDPDIPFVSAIVLAAGKAERLGSCKLGLQLAGQSILNRVVCTALASHVSEVVVVLGHYATELIGEIPQDERVSIVHNRHYEEGQHSSLKVGLGAVHKKTEAVVVLLGDQPFVTVEAINVVVSGFAKARAPLVMPLYEGKGGHPVMFSRQLFPELLDVSEQEGRREVVRRHRAEATMVTIAQEPPTDVDTWQDYQRLVHEASEFPASTRRSANGDGTSE